MKPVGAALLCLSLGACAPAARPAAPPPVNEDVRAARVLADHVADVFAHRYAPLELKARTMGWSLERETATLRAAIDRAPDAAAMRAAFQDFFRSPNDLHTTIELEGGRAVWLGAHFVTTSRGTYVAWVDPKLAPSIPLAVGDEVLKMDRRNVDEVRLRVAKEGRYHSTPTLERAFADWFLTMRSTSDVVSVPRPGERATLEVIRKDGAMARVVLPWRDLDTDGPSERCPFWPKARKSILPPLGDVIWEAPPESRFQTYAFSGGGRSWGFIRLHTYDLPPGAQQEAIREFDRAIDAFQRRDVEGIVLDQRGNGGGNYLFAYALFARLLDKPLLPTKQLYLVHGEEVVGFGPRAMLRPLAARLEAAHTDAEAKEALASIPLLDAAFGFAPRTLATAQGAGAFFRFLAEAEPGLTAPHFLLAPETLPDPSRGPAFTGPIVMLVDGMALSAADYVPATLQDNHRAVLFGETTAGAGGDQRREAADDPCTPAKRSRLVQVCTPPDAAAAMKRLGIRALDYTVSLGVRPDDAFLENVGVAPVGSVRARVPHVYAITAEDLATGFAPMILRIRAVLYSGGAQ